MKLKEYNRVVCVLLNVFDPRVPASTAVDGSPYGWVSDRSCRRLNEAAPLPPSQRPQVPVSRVANLSGSLLTLL